MSDDLLTPGEQTMLLRIARTTVEKAVGVDRAGSHDARDESDSNLRSKRGVFVTLHNIEGRHRKLRGCIGRMIGDKPLIALTAEMAVSAALHDPRFPPLRADDVSEIHFEISVLGRLTPVTDIGEIRIGIDGLLLRAGDRSGVFLPQVPVEQGWSVSVYLEQLCKKAGVAPGSWREPQSELLKFSAQVFAEP